MLLNQQGKQVHISDKLNSKTHPNVFANLREVKEPTQPYPKHMFSIEQRAHLEGKS